MEGHPCVWYTEVAFHGEISIGKVQKGVKHIIIIIKGHKLWIGINNIHCLLL